MQALCFSDFLAKRIFYIYHVFMTCLLYLSYTGGPKEISNSLFIITSRCTTPWTWANDNKSSNCSECNVWQVLKTFWEGGHYCSLQLLWTSFALANMERFRSVLVTKLHLSNTVENTRDSEKCCLGSDVKRFNELENLLKQLPFSWSQALSSSQLNYCFK
jgi:hypothetical protein